MNKVNLTGRLVRDPEIKFTQTNKAIARFTLAVNRKFKNAVGMYEADFINCICFEKRAELLRDYFNKGDMIGISGRIQTGSYEDQNGNKRYTTDIVVDELDFLQSKNKEQKEETENKDPFEDFGNEISTDEYLDD